MYLSKLVYLCVKNVLYYNDPSFDYNSFLLGTFDPDPDYDTNINNVFTPVNEAIARLNDLERIPYKVERVKFLDNTRTIDLNNVLNTSDATQKKALNVKEVRGVGQLINGVPYPLAFKHVGTTVLVLENLKNSAFPVYIEYKEDIPQFDRDDIPEKDPSTDELYEPTDELYSDVELKQEYGISDSMCNYIIEYVKGSLLEPIEPTLANLHITRAESYFSNTKPVSGLFQQRIIRQVYRIEN